MYLWIFKITLLIVGKMCKIRQKVGITRSMKSFRKMFTAASGPARRYSVGNPFVVLRIKPSYHLYVLYSASFEMLSLTINCSFVKAGNVNNWDHSMLKLL